MHICGFGEKCSPDAIEDMPETIAVRAKRLCRLMALEAPSILIQNEAMLLAQAMAVYRFAVSRKEVDTIQ